MYDTLIEEPFDADPYGRTGLSLTCPPRPNWEVTLGSADTSSGIMFRCFFKSPPNRLKRWLLKHCLGMYWTRVEEDSL